MMLVFNLECLAQITDSLPVRAYPQVNISGSRPQNKVAGFVPSRISSRLSDDLARRPEVYLRQYGLSGVSSISLNGLGASQTVVNWNGIILNSATLGQADANQFLSGQHTAIDFKPRSSYSSTQAASLGLHTLIPDSGITLEAGSQFGSYGHMGSQVGVGLRAKRFAAQAQYSWSEALNKYKVSDPTKDPAKSDYWVDLPNGRNFQRQAEGHLWHFCTVIQSQVHGFVSSWGRHLPPSTQSLNRPTNESLYGQNLGLAVSEIYDRYRDSARLNYSVSAENSRYGYPSDQVLPERFGFSRQVGSGSYYRKVLPEMKAGLAYEFVNETTPGYTVVGKRQRVLHYLTPGILALGQEVTLGAVLFQQKLFFTPQIKLAYKGFAASIKRSFRPPTFNDLYYPIFGSAGLMPEQGIHSELAWGSAFSVAKAILQIKATAGHRYFSNYLAWQPISNIFVAGNISRITNIYFTNLVNTNLDIAAVRILISNNLTITKLGNLDVAKGFKGNQLIYTPTFQNLTSVQAEWNGWALVLDGKYIGKRFTTSDNANYLKPVLLGNAFLSYSFFLKSFHLKPFLSFSNMNFLEKEFEWIDGYPMPRYEYKIGIQASSSF